MVIILALGTLERSPASQTMFTLTCRNTQTLNFIKGGEILTLPAFVLGVTKIAIDIITYTMAAAKREYLEFLFAQSAIVRSRSTSETVFVSAFHLAQTSNIILLKTIDALSANTS
jgi:hypothetical protein